MVEIFLLVFGVYALIGFLFAFPFVLTGVKQIDPAAKGGTWGFRILIFPGAAAFWPLLLKRWVSGVKSPPEEHNAHRKAAHLHAQPKEEKS